MTLKVIDRAFSVCKIRDASQTDLTADFCFIGKTDEELSLVCETVRAPADALERNDGWRALRVEGVLDFSLTGILSRLSSVLAGEGIGIFAVSTFNTDYILTKEANLSRALDALAADGWTIIGR